MLTKKFLKQIESYIKVKFIPPAPKRPQRGKIFKYTQAYIVQKIESQQSKISLKETLDERLQQLKETFPQYLLNLIAARGLNEVDVYKRANLDRRIFSKLRKQKGYMPRKRTILAIAFAMELNLGEAQDLLERGGYSLSQYSKEDVIISFFFENQIYDLFTVNEVLDHYGFKPLSC